MELLREVNMYAILMLAAFAATPEPMVRPKAERQLIVVAEGQLKVANEAAVKVFGPRAANTFSAVCVTEAKAKVYVASWPMTAEQKAAFSKAMEVELTAKTVTLHATKTPAAKLSELKLAPATDVVKER